MSIFGAMFAPDQQKAAAELLRVVKPGGRIGMGNWTPDGGVGEMFMTIAKHAPPPPGLDPPLLWGTEERAAGAVRRRRLRPAGRAPPSRQAFRSADHYLEFFRTYFGPMKMAFERVGPTAKRRSTATCGPSSKARTPPATAPWCSRPSTCRSSRRAPEAEAADVRR